MEHPSTSRCALSYPHKGKKQKNKKNTPPLFTPFY
jgi:hypothetical protein